MNIEILINNLMEFYQINSITRLAEKLRISQSTISGWRSRNSIGALTNTVASIDEKALSYIFASKADSKNRNPSDPVPTFMLDELNILFEGASRSGNSEQLIDAMYDFIASQKKIYHKFLG